MQLIIFTRAGRALPTLSNGLRQLAVKKMRKQRLPVSSPRLGGTQSSCSVRLADRSAQRAQTRGRNVSEFAFLMFCEEDFHVEAQSVCQVG
jgi:hypothetical protein